MKIFFSAGDVSGDINTAKIIADLKAKYPNAELRGLGGTQMQKAGFESFFEFSKFNKMGYWEVLTKLPFFLSAQRKFIRKMKEEKPQLLVCVDFSGFNKKLVVEANKLGIKVLWYIAPMIWIWKRAKYIKFFQENPAHIACVFPFEPKHWQPEIKNASFVGNPILESFDFEQFPKKNAVNPDKPWTLALICGSREQEVRKILPFMLDCVKALKSLCGSGNSSENIRLVVSKMPNLPNELYACAQDLGAEIETDYEKIMREADFALLTSGTASLQFGLAGVPHIVLYKTSPLTFTIFRRLIKKKPLIGLANIVAEKEICPEFIQNEMIVENVVDVLLGIVGNSSKYEEITRELQKLRSSLGEKKASEEIVSLIEKLIL